MPDRSITGVSADSTTSAARKQGRRLPNTNLEPKKFTRKELAEACRRQHIITDKSASSHQKSKHPLAPEAETDIESQVKVLDAGVKLCARKMNEYKSKGDLLDEDFKKKVDEYSSLKCETDALDEMIGGDNPETKKIEKLTTQMEGTTNESEAKLYYRNLLNYMLQRLRKNSISFDAHLGAMLNTCNGAEKEREKCERMLGEIESGHTMAIHELNTVSLEVHSDRSQRNRTLKNKISEANNAKSIEAWRNEKESSRLELEQLLGGAHKREIDKRNRILQDKSNQLEELNQLLEANNGEYNKMEEAFKHIKQATGVNTLTEMVDKFTNHQEHRERLLIEKKDAEESLSEAKASLESSLDKFNEIKVVGFGETELSREIIDDINTKIEHEKTEGRIVKSSNIRLEEALVELRQSVTVLYQRLGSYHPSLIGDNTPKFFDGAADSAVQAAYDTREMTNIAGKIIVRMLNAIGGIENINCLGNRESVESEEAIQILVSAQNDFHLGDNNCRVKPKVRSYHNILNLIWHHY